MQAAAVLYGAGKECSGPQICGIEMGCEGPRICGTEPACGGRQVRLHFRNAAGMYAHSENKGMEIKDFEIMDGEGRLFPVKAVIAENDVILTWKEKKTTIWKEENLFTGKEATARIQEIRYCYRNTNQGALLYEPVSARATGDISVGRNGGFG